MKKIFATCLAVAALSAPAFTATEAVAAACNTRAPVATLNLRPDSEGKLYFTQVGVNGENKLMVLSTSMGTTTFLSEAVSAMKLPVTNLRGATLATAVGSRGYDVTVATLTLGGQKQLPAVYLMYPPQADGEKLYAQNIVGWLGLDALMHYDVDLDFNANKVTLYDFKDCSGAPNANAQAVYFDTDSKGRIIVPVNLQGTVLNAALDSSSYQSALNLSVAEDNLLYTPNPAEKLSGEDAPTAMDAYRHRFSSMMIDGVTVTNPTFLVIQDKLRQKVTATPETGSNIRANAEDNRMPDFLIGHDFMKDYHIYIASQEHRLYITPTAR